jgi:hypothetical protein
MRQETELFIHDLIKVINLMRTTNTTEHTFTFKDIEVDLTMRRRDG